MRLFGAVFLIAVFFSFSAVTVPLCRSFYSDSQLVDRIDVKVEKRVTYIIDHNLNLNRSDKNPFTRLIEDLNDLYQESSTSENSIRHRDELRAWKHLQQEALSRGKPIEYQEYVELSSLYMLIANDIVNKRSSNFERSHKIAKQIADVLAANYPHFTYIFTSRELGAREFNQISGEPIFYVGITNERLHVDLTRMNPLSFFIHDMNHAAASLNLFGPNIPRESTDLGFKGEYVFQRFPAFKLTEDQKANVFFWVAQNIELRNKVFTSLANEKNELLNKSVNSLWFFFFHERTLKMTKQDLKLELMHLSRLEDDLIYISKEKMQNPSSWVYYFLKETMESQGVKDRKSVLKGIREGIKWLLEEL